MTRVDGRAPDQLRPISAERGYSEFAEGSVLYACGRTRVLVTASVEDKVPDFLRGTGKGWVTAEYSMLPRATETRSPREAAKGRQSGRTQEIQRLVGRALRSVCDLKKMGERTIWLDCDVLQADGGTRTASISAAYIALADACNLLIERGRMAASPVREEVAAVSVGIVDGEPFLDLAYTEDSVAQVDLNLVMCASGGFVELQGTAEGLPFTADELQAMLDLGRKGIGEIIATQRRVLGEPRS